MLLSRSILYCNSLIPSIEFLQRYFVNGEYYKAGGPVFLMIGGEGAITPKWMVEGQWIEYAKKYGALCFQVEHRFYGQSHPTLYVYSRTLYHDYMPTFTLLISHV